ncbi:MAG: DUF1592 domain-containing protein [Acidobacteria bacterium]|nr:DUF1592 domain-containing protein [Acidobacteriota bacterium]
MHIFLLLLLLSASAFAQEPVYAVFEKADCHSCHNRDGVAAGTRLLFPEGIVSAEKKEAFLLSLVTLVDRLDPAKSVLLEKPTKRTSHVGGERIKQGSPEEATLRSWIGQLAKLNGDALAKALRYREEEEGGGGQVAPRVELRRLTHSQYNQTVRDLVGDVSKPADRFPPEDFVNGFRNQIQGQSLSPLLIESYSEAAERIAQSAMRGGDTRGLIGCKPSLACRAKFVREFGLKAFRRPVENGEQKRYEALFATEKEFVKGAQLVIEAMLQSTNFLFRLEETSDPKLKPYVTASRLSYALWDTMPDASLFAAAAQGSVDVRAQVNRMLDNPRAKVALNEFVGQWLRFDRILTASKDRRKHPQFTRETAVAMTEEARLFVSDLVWNDRNFMELFTAPYGYVNGELAGIYGVPAPAQEFGKVTFPAASERAGILGQALFLASTAKPDESSPTARGLFVREQFLCQHVPDPPAGVNTNLPPFSAERPETNRERLSAHVINPGCASCHSLIDPIGFGFEKFDAIGARRDKFEFTTPGRGQKAPAKAWTLEIDSTGFVAGVAKSAFASPSALGAVLGESAQCQECLVKQYFRYTFGRTETAADRPVIRQLTEDFRRSQYRFKALIASIMLSRENPGGAVHAARNHESR